VTYDQKCYDLAEAFLPEHPKLREALAERIQETIEDFIEEQDIKP
jgi:hypothetical protein